MKPYKDYEIIDLRKGLFADSIKVLAPTPTQAIKFAYPDLKFERDYECKGEIVVKTARSSYVYKVLK